MSVYKQHEMMQEAFQEAKTIINNIFIKINAPSNWQIIHMTFDELIAALYKLLGLFDGSLRDPVTVTEDDLLQDVTAFNSDLEVVIGNIEKISEMMYMPSTEDQLIIPEGKYTNGNQYVAGDINLIPENIRKDISIFGVEGVLDPESGSSGSDSP